MKSMYRRVRAFFTQFRKSLHAPRAISLYSGKIQVTDITIVACYRLGIVVVDPVLIRIFLDPKGKRRRLAPISVQPFKGRLFNAGHVDAVQKLLLAYGWQQLQPALLRSWLLKIDLQLALRPGNLSPVLNWYGEVQPDSKLGLVVRVCTPEEFDNSKTGTIVGPVTAQSLEMALLKVEQQAKRIRA